MAEFPSSHLRLKMAIVYLSLKTRKKSIKIDTMNKIWKVIFHVPSVKITARSSQLFPIFHQLWPWKCRLCLLFNFPPGTASTFVSITGHFFGCSSSFLPFRLVRTFLCLLALPSAWFWPTTFLTTSIHNPTSSPCLFRPRRQCRCDELITRPDESYRLWYVVVCDIEISWMRRPWPTGGCRAKNKQAIFVTTQNTKKNKKCNKKLKTFIWRFDLNVLWAYGNSGLRKK
jgi:hypothetical protein